MPGFVGFMGDGTGAGTRGLQITPAQVAAASSAMLAANAAGGIA